MSSRRKPTVNESVEGTNKTVSQTDTYLCQDYNITTSLCSGDSIFIIIINSITFQNYEGVFNKNDIDSLPSLEIFYKIMSKAFNKIENYNVRLELKSNLLTLYFEAILDGFYVLSQHISLKEKTLNGDKLVTIKLTELESKQVQEIRRLENRIKELESEEICLAYGTDFGQFMKISKTTQELDFISFAKYTQFGNINDFNKFTKCNKIIINSNQFMYNFNPIQTVYSGTIIESFSINTHHYGIIANNNFNKLLNLFDVRQIYLTSVRELVIIGQETYTCPTNLRSLPNLSKIQFVNYTDKSITSFDLIKNTPTFKHIIYESCLNIANLAEIKNWCDSKGIKLEIK